MEIDRARGAVVILRASGPSTVPAWLHGEEASERLRDGSFVVPAGLHRIGDSTYAVRCITEAISGDLSFHHDERGLRWTRFSPIASKLRVEANGEFGRFPAYDLDYETCVSAVGLWVPLAKVTARRSTQTVEEARKQLAATRLPPPDEERVESGVQHRNVVIVRGAPKALPKEFVVLYRLPDGTVLGVGPRNRGWVDWLKRNVPLESLRLMKGPVSDSFLKEVTSFEMLDAACRLQGQPLLVMKSS
jgi:hypothetical protein